MHAQILLGYGGGGGGGPISFSFDPARKNANVTLSLSDTRASTTADSAHNKAYGTKPKNSGKWIFEFIVANASNDVGFGIANQAAGWTSTTYPYPNGTGASSGNFWSRATGSLSRLYNNSSFTIPSPVVIAATGDIITIGVDFGAKTMLAKRNGTLVGSWSVSAIDPATYSYVPYVALWGAAGNACTVDIHPTVQYPEAGYSPWA